MTENSFILMVKNHETSFILFLFLLFIYLTFMKYYPFNHTHPSKKIIKVVLYFPSDMKYNMYLAKD